MANNIIKISKTGTKVVKIVSQGPQGAKGPTGHTGPTGSVFPHNANDIGRIDNNGQALLTGSLFVTSSISGSGQSYLTGGGHITASGNIRALGNVVGTTGSFDYMVLTGSIASDGNITANTASFQQLLLDGNVILNQDTSIISSGDYDLTINPSDNLYLGTSETDNIYIGKNTGENYVKIEAGSSNTVFISGSKVGLGNRYPQQTLTVTGDISSSGNITVEGSITASGDISSSGTITAANISIGGTGGSGLNVIGDITASGNISASGTIYADNFSSTGGNTDGISFTDELNLTGNLTASGDISSSGTITAANISIGGTGGTGLSIIGDITASGHISTSLFSTGSFGHIYTGEISASYRPHSSSGIIRAFDGKYTTITSSNAIIYTSSFNVISSSLFPDKNSTYNLGSAIKEWKDLHVDGTAYINNLDSFTTTDISAQHITSSGNISSSGNIKIQHITASGNIKASGDIEALTFTSPTLDITGGSAQITAGIPITFGSLVSINTGKLNIKHDDSEGLIVNNSGLLTISNTGGSGIKLGTDATQHITASGNISSSGTIKGVSGSFSHILGNSPITVQDAITFQSHITASGNISASGTIMASSITLGGGGTPGTLTSTNIHSTGSITASIISASSLIATTIDINGGFIDNTTIGSTTPSTGIFSTIKSTGFLSASGNLVVEQSASIAGDLTVGGIVTATEIHVTIVSASVTHATGSNTFGDALDDKHYFTGSLIVSNSLNVTGQVTSSGPISASGIITAAHFHSSTGALITNNLTAGSGVTDTHTLTGETTFTGNISSSGQLIIKSNTPKIRIDANAGRSVDIDVVGNNFKIEDVANNSSIFVTDLSTNPTTTDFYTIPTFKKSTTFELDTVTLGNIKTGGTLHLSASGGHITASGNISASGTIIAGNINIGGTGGSGLNVIGDITASGNISSSGNLSATGDLDVDGKSHFTGHITASGNISSSGTGDNYFGGTVKLYSAAAADQKIEFGNTDQYIQGGDNYLYIDGDNQIILLADSQLLVSSSKTGIGNFKANITPGAVLHVSGTTATDTTFLVEGSDGTDYLTVGLGGHITASGNISASGTGSFNKITTNDAKIYGSVLIQDGLLKFDDIGGSATYFSNSGVNFYYSPNFKIQEEGIDIAYFKSGSLKIIGGITASGDISASGTITAANLNIGGTGGTGLSITGDITASGNISASGTSHIFGGDITNNGDIITTQITASGDISSSGNIYGNIIYAHRFESSGSSDSIDISDNLDITGHITASGNIINTGNIITTHITASGNISSSGTGSFTNVTILNDESTANPRLILGRSTHENVRFDVTDLNITITADQDSDTNGNHEFRLDREFLGTGANNFVIQKDGTDQFIIDAGANITSSGNIKSVNISTTGHITASGNISASGTVHSITGSFGVLTGLNHVTFTSPGVIFSTPVTASSHISSSTGTIYAEHFHSSDDAVISSTLTVGTITNVNTTNVTASANISSSGTGSFNKLGIGDASPTSSLSIAGDSQFRLPSDINKGERGILISPKTYDKFQVIKGYNGLELQGHNTASGVPSASMITLDTNSGGSGSIMFTTSGSERVRIDGEGNVGIGTASPGEKLEVVGNISASGNFVANQITASGDIQTNVVRGYTYPTYNILSLEDDNLPNQNGVSLHSVGSMAHYIDVNNNSSNDSFDWLADDNSAGSATNLMSLTDEGNLSVSGTGSFSEGRFTGKVGIGTTTPGEKLEVVGNISASGDIIGSELNIISSNLNGSSRMNRITYDTGHSGSMILRDEHATLDLYNPLEADTLEKGSVLTFSDNYYGGSSYNQTTRAAIKGGTATIGNTANGFLAFYTDKSGADTMLEAMRIDEDGNVGIGTTTPGNLLHLSASVATHPLMVIDNKSGAAGGGLQIKTSDGNGTGTAFEVINYQNVSPKTIIKIPTWKTSDGYGALFPDGNVGIGTTTPGESLAVVGNISASGTIISSKAHIATPGIFTANTSADELVIGSGTGTQGMTIYGATGTIYFATDLDEEGAGDNPAGNRHGIIEYTPSEFKLKTSGNQLAATISNGGSTFANNLTVEGSITSSGNISASGTITANAFVGDGSGLTNVSTTAITGLMSNGVNNRLVTATGASSLDAEANLTFDDTTNLLYLNGSMGIGTGVPESSLHVYNGYLQVEPITYAANQDNWALKINAYDNAGWDDDTGIKFKANALGQPYLSIHQANGERMVFANSNVGIGTATPPEKLTVQGNISASGTINTLSHITASGNISSSGTIMASDIILNVGSLVNATDDVDASSQLVPVGGIYRNGNALSIRIT